MDLLDHVLITVFFLFSTESITRFSSLKSTNGPFFSDLAMTDYFLRFSIMYMLDALLLLRVLYPFAGIPFRERG